MWTDALTNLGTTATNVISSLGQTEATKNQAKAAKSAADAQASNAATIKKILPWAIGAVVLLVLVFVFVRRK